MNLQRFPSGVNFPSGKIITDFEPDITKSFNRGYTDYFLDKRKDCFNFDGYKGEFIGQIIKVGKNFFETDSNKKLYPQDGLLIGNEGCLVNKVEGNKIYPNKMPEITKGNPVFRNKDALYEKKLNSAKIVRKIGIDITVENNTIIAGDDDNNNVSINLPEGEPAKNQEKMNENFIAQMRKTGDTIFDVNDINLNTKIPFLPFSLVNELRRELLEKLLKERQKNYHKEEQKELHYIQYYKNSDDYKANVYNSSAKNFYKNCGCEITEPAFEAGCSHKIELMRTKHCIKYALNLCKSPQKLFLVDDRNKKYELQFDCKNCEMVIVG